MNGLICTQEQNAVNQPAFVFCHAGRRILFGSVVLALLLCARVGQAQRAPDSSTLEPLPPASPDPVQSVAVERLQLDEIRQLVREGLDDQIIMEVIRERGVARPLAVVDLVSLRRAGVSNEVIKEIQKAAPKAKVVSAPQSVRQVEVYEAPSPPVIIQTVPRYYVRPAPSFYYWGPPHFHPHHPPHRYPPGGGRISLGFSF